MFERFSLPDIPRVARRTVLGAAVLGIVALVALALVGYPLLGLGVGIGLGLGIVNFRMVTATVIKVGQRAQENKRRPLATNTLARLGVISALIFGLLFLSFNLGFGVLAGMALFYMLLLLNVTRAMYVAGYRRTDGAGLANPSGTGVIDAVAGPVDSVASEHREREDH